MYIPLWYYYGDNKHTLVVLLRRHWIYPCGIITETLNIPLWCYYGDTGYYTWIICYDKVTTREWIITTTVTICVNVTRQCNYTCMNVTTTWISLECMLRHATTLVWMLRPCYYLSDMLRPCNHTCILRRHAITWVIGYDHVTTLVYYDDMLLLEWYVTTM
jgi:hypothetical protein